MTPAERRRAFALLLDAERRTRHLSIRDLARIAKVPTATMQGWLSGRHLPMPALRPAYLHVVELLGLTSELPADLWDDGGGSLAHQLRVGRPPYLGLRAYQPADTALYFGRREESRRLADAVRGLREAEGHGLLVVVGASGSGKSSLLGAGLIGRECTDGRLAGWDVESVRATDLVTGVPSAELVVVDQFEEAFGLEESHLEEAIENLAQAAGRAVVVIAIRADAFAAASLQPALAGALSRPFLVVPLTREQAREVVVGPAQLSGVVVDEDLVPALLDDLLMGNRSGVVGADVLPLLSSALLTTWASGSGGRMTVSDYVRSGGVWAALAGLAEEAFASLSASEQAAARLLFLRLVRADGDLLQREPVALDDLDAEGTTAMNAFLDARMLTVSDGSVRVSHDALIANWPRLQEWLADHRADGEVVDQLRRAARVWVDTGRATDALIPVERLEVFAEWVTDPARQGLLSPREQEFVEASREHFHSALAAEQAVGRRLRRSRRLAVGLTAVTSALALIAGTMYWRGLGLQQQADDARLEAQSRQVALEARSVRTDDPNLMAQMSLVAYRQAVTRQSESALLDATAVNTPLRWLGKPNAVLAKSADDQLVARADGAGEVTLWRGGELVRDAGSTFQVDPKAGPLYAVALAALGTHTLLAVGGGTAAGLWDVTGAPHLLTDLTTPGVTVYGAAFSGDGHRLALATSTGDVKLWSVAESGATPAGSVSIGASSPAKAVAISPTSGELFVAGLPDAVARFTAGASVHRLADLTFTHPGTPVVSQSLAVSPSGEQLVAGIAGRQVPRWSLTGARPAALAPLTGFLSWTNDLSYSRDGSRLIVANSDKNSYVFDTASGQLLQTLPGATVDTGAELVGGRPVTSGADGVLRVWQARNPVLRTGSTIYALSTDPGGRFLAASSISDGQQLWSTSEAGPVRLPDPATGGRSMSSAVAVAPNASYLLGGTTDGSVLSWPLGPSGAGSASTIAAFPGSYIGAIAASPDSSLVAVLQYTGTHVALYSAKTSGELSLLAKLDTPTPQGISFSPDGRLLAVPIVGGVVQLWDVGTPSAPVLAGTIRGIGALPTIIAFANHSRTLAVGTDAGNVGVWDVSDPAAPVAHKIFGDPHAAVYGVAFSPDDAALAAVGGDGLVWAWRLDGSESAYLSLNGDLGAGAYDVRFLDGGQELVAGGDNGVLRVWTAQPEAAVAQLCANRGDVLSADEWARFLPGVAVRDPC